MTTAATIPQPLERTELLPGYLPLEKLGSGGYGEVWKAEAPGGLVKAVKVLFGFSHEQRATDELKALERVKQVRHPFLLSLERIETVDHRLFIVTELADQSLKDCFNEYLRRGKNGIGRAELLNYLRDAADALDFMSEVHGLQHLDIKPENLLLVAGHIKVADFGLVKDIARQNVSLVGGLTPIYAAPEVFHGRPSRYSDQYSLAVVYQQMLTSTLPFAGGSAAELTLQHLNEEPDLTPLPPCDQPTIARALSKNPDHRFASCRTMIDALIQGANAPGLAAADDRRSAHGARDSQPVSDFNLTLDRAHAGHLSAVAEPASTTTNITLEFGELEPARLARRAAPAIDAEAFEPAPTLLVGIGGLAGTVLCEFKKRLRERFASAGEIPAIATLLIDTDSSDLLAATHGTGAGCLQPHETLPVPLRRPQEYRSRHGQPFRWLSRRWLYNVPRSLKTEGLRPLGRLAFVDHASPIRARLMQALDDVLDESAVQQSREATQLPFDAKRLRVYVVASICGGTGSGMVLDLAYLLGGLISGRGVDCDGVTGLMLIGTPERARARELAAVNAFAWLTEYNHFNRPGAAFPGDTSCGLEPKEVDERAFASTYVVPLGEEGNPSEFAQRAASVAEYIYLDAFTPAQSFLKGCRAVQADDELAPRERAPLCTFALTVHDATRNREVDLVSGELAQKVIASWLGTQPDAASTDTHATSGADTQQGETDAPAPRPVSEIEQVCLAESSKLQLEVDELVALGAKLVEMELGAPPREFYQRLVVELRGKRPAISPLTVVQAIDRMFGSQAGQGRDRAEGTVVLRKPVGAIVKPLSERMEAHLGNWLYGRLDDPALRLAGALGAANWFTSHLRALGKTLSLYMGRETRNLEQAAAAFALPEAETPSMEEAAFGYFQLQLQRAAAGAASAIARGLSATTANVRDRLVATGGTIRLLAARLRETHDSSHRAAGEADATAEQTRRRLAELLIAREAEWIAAVDQIVQENLTARAGGLYRSLSTDAPLQESLVKAVEEAARRCICSVVSDTNILEGLLGSGERAQDRLEALLTDAEGDCLEHGGTVRQLVIVPHNSDPETVRERIAQLGREDVAIVRHPENQLAICTEIQNVSLPHLAKAIIRNRRDYAGFAQRVLSRKDVQWSPAIAAAPEAAANCEMQTIVL